MSELYSSSEMDQMIEPDNQGSIFLLTNKIESISLLLFVWKRDSEICTLSFLGFQSNYTIEFFYGFLHNE